MSDIKVITKDFNAGGSGSDYAKVFTMKKRFLNQASWHNNQILFKAIHAPSANGIFSKTYFISIFESDTPGPSTIKFKLVSNDDVSDVINCVYVDTGTEIDIYAKGGVSGANVKIQVLYSPKIGMIDFYNYGSFDNDLALLTPVEPDFKDGEITLTPFGSWTFLGSYYNKIYKQGNLIVINAALTGGAVAGTQKLFTLPVAYAPAERIRTVCQYLDGGGNYLNALCEISDTFGDILITGVAANTEVFVNITFSI